MKSACTSTLAALLFTAASASAQNQTVVTPQQPAPQPPPPVVIQAPPPQGQQTTVVAPPQQTTAAVVNARAESAGYDRVPNRSLLITGAILFGATYLPSVVVGASSTNDADRALFVPIVGPFIDMGARKSCGTDSCDSAETANKFFLAADGVLQAVGAFTFASAFIFPTRVYRSDTVVTGKSITITPMQMGRGPSLGAGVVGTF